MNPKTFTLIILSFLIGTETFGQNIVIPDINFKQCLLADATINSNRDSAISKEEANEAWKINCIKQGVYNVVENLSGLDEFTNIIQLSISVKKIDSIDLSFAPKLIDVAIIDSSKYDTSALKHVRIDSNPNLEAVTIKDSRMEHLVFPNSSNLITVILLNNKEIKDIDFTPIKNLEYLYISGSDIKELNFSQSSKLSIESIDITGNKFDTLALQGFPNLQRLDCSNNPIVYFDVSDLNSLRHLGAMNIGLTSLDVSNFSNLEKLMLDSNGISEFDISQNDRLQYLFINNNDLEELNLKNGNNLYMIVEALENKKLKCVTVDSAEWSTMYWPTRFDDGITFSTNCTNLHSSLTKAVNLKLHPNPASSSFSFEYGVKPGSFITLTDVNGKIVMTFQSNSQNHYNISNLRSGVYIVELKVEDSIYRARLVKD